MGKCIASEEEAPEIVAQDGGCVPIDGSENAFETLFRAQSQVAPAYGEILDLAGMLNVLRRAHVVVYVLAFHLVLIIDTGVHHVMAFKFQQFHFVDDQGPVAALEVEEQIAWSAERLRVGNQRSDCTGG